MFLRLVVEHVETVLEVFEKLPLRARAVRLPELEVVAEVELVMAIGLVMASR
jgi:hypothetical protein